MKHEKHFHHNQEPTGNSLCAGPAPLVRVNQGGERFGKNKVIAAQGSLYFGPKISKTIIFPLKVPRKFHEVST